MHPYGEGYFERGELSNYSGYGDDFGWPATARIVAKHAHVGARLYEYGAAKGYFVLHAVMHGLDAYGMDISEYAVENAPVQVKSRMKVHDSNGLPWESLTGDVVCSWEYLEHVDTEDVRGVLSRMMALCKPGGLMIHRIDVIDGKHDPYSDKTHVSIFLPVWWRTEFETVGGINVAAIEYELNEEFAERDWSGRFFAYRKPYAPYV